MLKLKKVNDLENLILNQVQESLHLDYKNSDAIDSGKKNDISKDVSAFANSDGGSIVYGISETDHLPVSIDGGVDHKKYSREWLEQVINSNVFPKIDNLNIIQIPLSKDKSAFVVTIPKSYRGPHQASDKRYYRRYNFMSVPMENYEVEDIRNRATAVVPLLNFDAIIPEHNIVHLEFSNIGNLPATDVTFKFKPALKWHDAVYYPKLFSQGARFVAPGKKITFFYHSYVEIVNDPSIPKSFDIYITYIHPVIGRKATDKFHIDFMDFYSSLHVKSDAEENTEALKKGLDEIKSVLSKISNHTEDISSITDATGLRLSLNTILNLQHLLSGDRTIEKLNPYRVDASVFREVLDIDIGTAHQLDWFFRDIDEVEHKKLSDVPGITDEIAKKLRRYFTIPEHLL
ncbi:MAG: ATP-binding protein [Caldilineaceae bacterium]